MTPRATLLEEIFTGIESPLYPEFAKWAQQSRAFLAFATANRSKIRAKIRTARDAERMEDVRAELATAATLLRDERMTLEYETYVALGVRGPDFTATYRQNTRVNVEVRRLRARRAGSDEKDALTVKLVEVLADKIGQMPPSAINLLWFVMDERSGDETITLSDITNALAVLRELAEKKVEEFFTRRGFKNTGDYQKHLAQLSAIMMQRENSGELWLNPLARHKLPNDVANTLRRLTVET